MIKENFRGWKELTYYAETENTQSYVQKNLRYKKWKIQTRKSIQKPYPEQKDHEKKKKSEKSGICERSKRESD